MAKLTVNENPQGFTDEITISFEDFSVANAKASAKLVTAFDDSGSGDDLTITVGDGDDADGYLTAADIHVDATEISYVANTGALLDNENGKVYTAADTIDILFSPDTDNDAPYSLNELTAGEIKLKFEICDLN